MSFYPIKSLLGLILGDIPIPPVATPLTISIIAQQPTLISEPPGAALPGHWPRGGTVHGGN